MRSWRTRLAMAGVRGLRITRLRTDLRAARRSIAVLSITQRADPVDVYEPRAGATTSR